MQSNARMFTLLAATIVVAIVCVLVGAQPQEKPLPPRQTLPQERVVPQPQPNTAPSTPPISFEDPDGQELILEELSARTAIQGMLSLTELEFRFRNPTERRIEGRFSFALPPNAAISRFAKDVNGHLMEGEVVERLRANQVYEQYLHVMRDPALLEQDQGNRFSARIFPIEPNAPVHLVLSYTSLLPLRDGMRTYTLPLRGMQKVNKLTFKAFVSPLPGEEAVGAAQQASSSITGLANATRSTAEVISFEERDRTPERDVVLSWRPTANASRARVLRAGDFYLASFRPEPRIERSMPPRSWLLYVDTSASSAEGAPHRIRALEELLAALPSGDRVEVRAFDQDIATLGNSNAAELSRSIGNLLRARLFLGGTDIGSLVRNITRAANEEPSRAIVVASDLVATLGATERKDLTDAMAQLPRAARIHALILGSREDAPIAKSLTAGRGRVVRVAFTDTLAQNARTAASELRRPLGVAIDINDPSAEWVYPTRVDDVSPGDEVIVLGKLRAASEPAVRIAGSDVRAASQPLPAGTFAPLLEREAYRMYLEYLAEREANEQSDAVRRALATEQVRISVEQRVVIPRTTMLVLETEWEYQRFGLDRRALAAILTIDAGGIGRIDRKAEQWMPPPPMPAMPRPQTRRDRSKGGMPVPPPVVTAPVATPEASEGSVQGSVAGGVVGGTAAGVDVSMRDQAATLEEAIPVTQATSADAQRLITPAQPPSAPPPPPVAKRSDPRWVRVERPSRARIDELEAQLRNDPRNRELYNQLSEVLAAHREWSALRALALRWQPYDPENPQVYEVLGLADDRLGNETEAARAYASLIEVAPAKTELLQRAGLLLLRARRASLAEAPLRKALDVRPDRPNGYRHLALMLWRDGRLEEAARVLESATRQNFQAWYGNAQRVIREELGYVYRAWIEKEPSRRAEIEQRARDYDVDLRRTDALRITLAWETDANDVDLHVVDPSGEECFYGDKATKSGLVLYEDITQGLGPEVIRTDRVQRGTYHVGVRYFNAGPMGVSRGIVVVMRNGDVEIHPFRLVAGGGEIRYVAGVEIK